MAENWLAQQLTGQTFSETVCFGKDIFEFEIIADMRGVVTEFWMQRASRRRRMMTDWLEGIQKAALVYRMRNPEIPVAGFNFAEYDDAKFVVNFRFTKADVMTLCCLMFQRLILGRLKMIESARWRLFAFC